MNKEEFDKIRTDLHKAMDNRDEAFDRNKIASQELMDAEKVFKDASDKYYYNKDCQDFLRIDREEQIEKLKGLKQ